MLNRPFRFVHASDLHLERVPHGMADAPEHRLDVLARSPYLAAQRLFDAVLAEQADFLVLAGDVLRADATGPRGPLFLAEQFARLAERGIEVYWAGGEIDPPEAWPAAIALPENVHRFSRQRVEEFLLERDAIAVARLVGISRDDQWPARPEQFDPDPAGVFTIGVLPGPADPAGLAQRGLNYWALGGPHDRSTPSGQGVGGPIVHWPGTPQGRFPGEPGAHGCTLVEVDPAGQVRTSLLPTDVLRWSNEEVAIDGVADPGGLRSLVHQRAAELADAAPAVDLMVSWRLIGGGPLAGALRRGGLRQTLLDGLRREFGGRSPCLWSIALELETAAQPSEEWYTEETIRGEFLRAMRELQGDFGAPLGLDDYLADPRIAEVLGPLLRPADADARRLLLDSAMLLGVDLLSGEEPAAVPADEQGGAAR